MEFLRLLESARLPALDAFFSAVTYLGDELAFMALALLLFWCVDKRTGYYVFVVGLFGTLANQFLKILCRVPRRGIPSRPGTHRTPSGPSGPSAFWQSADGSTSRASRWSFLCRFRGCIWGSTLLWTSVWHS